MSKEIKVSIVIFEVIRTKRKIICIKMWVSKNRWIHIILKRLYKMIPMWNQLLIEYLSKEMARCPTILFTQVKTLCCFTDNVLYFKTRVVQIKRIDSKVQKESLVNQAADEMIIYTTSSYLQILKSVLVYNHKYVYIPYLNSCTVATNRSFIFHKYLESSIVTDFKRKNGKIKHKVFSK